jgi:hypothetical protein
MKKSKIINQTTHSGVNTSADVSIGYAPEEDVVKHVKVQGSRKRAYPVTSIIPRLNNALMPKYQCKAEYSSFWAPLMNPFVLNQMQWEIGMFCKATDSSSTVRSDGLDLSKGAIPIKKNDTHGMLSSTVNGMFNHNNSHVYKLATVGQSTQSSSDQSKELSKYIGAEHYSELYDAQNTERKSLRCATNNMDVPGGRQGVQVFWLNDKHTRRERQRKAVNMATSIQSDTRNGISVRNDTTDPKDDVYRDLNYPSAEQMNDIDSDNGPVLYNENPQYDLEHDMMEITYTNTSNKVVYLEFVEYEPQVGATGPLEYYDEIVAEMQQLHAADAYVEYVDNETKPNILTPVPPSAINASNMWTRQMSRLNEIQYGDKVKLDLIGSASADPEGLGRLQANVLAPRISRMVMTGMDTAKTWGAMTAPFNQNYGPKLCNVAVQTKAAAAATDELPSQPAEYKPRLLSHTAASAPGCFIHQTTDENGSQWHLNQLGTVASNQQWTDGSNTNGLSHWRPVNMMNLSSTQNPNTDIHMTFQRGQDSEVLVPVTVAGKFIKPDGTIVNSATSGQGDADYTGPYPALKAKGTQRKAYATRTEDTDARLLLPNYANEWIKLWREDLYEAENKTTNKRNTKRPFGNALQSDASTLKQMSVYDQIGDKWLEPGARPTGRAFNSRYKQKKKTRIMVEPNSLVTYQFFADPGIEGESNLLTSDLVKKNDYGLIDLKDSSGTSVDANSILNHQSEEFVDKLQHQNQFFDSRSRCCMVFINGAPHLIDGEHTTEPASVNYQIKTLEKVTSVPRFYNKMSKFHHAVDFPDISQKRYFDSQFVDKDGKPYKDYKDHSYADSIRTPNVIAHAHRNRQTDGLADEIFGTGGSVDLFDSFAAEQARDNMLTINRSYGTGQIADIAGSLSQLVYGGAEQALGVLKAVSTGYKNLKNDEFIQEVVIPAVGSLAAATVAANNAKDPFNPQYTTDEMGGFNQEF